jgi:hypothetical protein
MKVREGVFLFAMGLGFDHALCLGGFGGSKIPFSFFVMCGGKALARWIRYVFFQCFIRNKDCPACSYHYLEVSLLNTFSAFTHCRRRSVSHMTARVYFPRLQTARILNGSPATYDITLYFTSH